MRLKTTLAALLLPLVMLAANTVTIPTASGTYIDWNDCDLTAANVENSGANIGSTGKNTVATFTLNNTNVQDYILTFATGSKNEATILVTLTNTATDAVALSKSVTVENTGSWTPSTINNILLSQLPAGTYELKMQVTAATSYAGNWGKLAVYSTDGYNSIPGTIAVATGGYGGGARLENKDTNVGWISNNTSATYSFICSQAGVYKMTIPMTRYGDGTITTIVTDEETGIEEARGTWTVTNASDYAPTDVPIEGELTTGMKTLTMQFATTSNFLFNYKDFEVVRLCDHYAKINGVSLSGQTVTTGDDSDWYCQLPASYDATTTFSVLVQSGTVSVTRADGSANAVDVTDNGDGTFTMPTPAPGSATTVTMTLTPDADAASSKTEYTFKLFRIGEISLTDVLVDDISIDVLSEMNSNQSATYNDCYTAVPTVKVKVVDGSVVTAPAPTIDGAQATYSISVEMAGLTKNYTLVINGLNIYEAGEADEKVELKYTTEGNDKTNNIWSNGLYSLTPIGDGWSNSGFKMKSNSTNTLSMPSDVKVKQFIIHQFSDNYAPGSFGTITSEGMTAYIPAKHNFVNGQQYDLVINLEGHEAGTPIVFTLNDGSQPTGWFELTIEKQAITTAPTVQSQSVTVVNNHAVVSLTFDREMTSTTATINGGNVTAEGGSATLDFAVWNLDYDNSYTLTIPAGAAKDTYNNANAESINVAVNTEAKAVTEKQAYDYVVGTAEEFSAAVAAVNSSNSTAAAARKTIFVKNGDYDFGAVEQRITGYNVSLIGESRDGVILHGNRSGISNPVLNLRDRTGFYLQDLTVRNDCDYGAPKTGNFKGVAVAIYGGDKTIMKNVRMLSNQDTQVTGHRAYFENCEIHGTVDFICGGGDNFYYNTALVLEDRNGNVISAPSTSSSLKWGYVFQHCTVSAVEGATSVVDGSWNLGRPWQDTPRATYLNTTMNVLASAGGWAAMSTLPTYFYEYNSMKADGSAVDLSDRTNSSTSTNTYTPVLTADEAAKYTLENVLGGTDSWLPTDYTNVVAAPVVSLNGATLSWTDVEDALCYIIYKDGEYLANQTATTYELTEEGLYTVRAANGMGGLGAEATSVAFKRSITAGNWSTIVVPFDIAEADIANVFGAQTSVAELTDGTENMLNFSTTLSDGKMKANQPYAIKVQTDFSQAVINNVVIVEGEPVQTVEGWTFNGSYTEGTVPAGSYYFKDNSPYRATGTQKVKPFRAYFTPSSTNAAHAAVLDVTFDGETTGVKNVNGNVNGQSSTIYNLNGQRSGKPAQRGLYITNGKKYIYK